MDYLFKTTDSVIEILWDVALAFFIVRIALAYFFLTFATSTLLSWIVYTYHQNLVLPLVSDQQQQQQHHLTTSQTGFVLAPILQAIVGLVVARYIVVAYDVPRVAWFRLAIGGLAAAFLVSAAALLGLAMYMYEGGYGRDCWVWEEMDWWVLAALLGGTGVFAVTPTALMGFERVELRGKMGMQGLDSKGA
ncbi:hypothetical protein CORC01_05087 [Colletotrichum orchidophilum]|uniref:Uncharacterized protein n=1 Tax=Colletotrichum orchidophilum TaxID=1209926 RepID=A0A1G4BDI8_9PEZI|nr:uncharacterized protein CORC01_05087 [Colletotrichum orchidophilum]OHE99509.1 hypothetical protein CORC01_05087 [Colletotrichum orchidophilum]